MTALQAVICATEEAAVRRVLWAWGLCLAGVALAASPAAAATVSLNLSAVRIAPGGVVTIAGQCQAHSTGFVISAAFLHDATHDFAGVGAVAFATSSSGKFTVVARIPATRALGVYTVTARCGGGNLGIARSLTVVTATLPATGSGPAASITAWALILTAAGGALLALERRTAPQGS